MPIRVACACGKVYNFKDEFAGRRAKCPACGKVVNIPGSRIGAAAPSPPSHAHAVSRAANAEDATPQEGLALGRREKPVEDLDWPRDRTDILDALHSDDETEKAWALDLLNRYALEGVDEAKELISANSQAVVGIAERPATAAPIQEGKGCPGPDRTSFAGGPTPVAIESAIGKLLLGMAQAESKRGAPAGFERQCRDENRIVNQWQSSPEESFRMALAIAGDENAEPILRKQARWALALMYRRGADMERLATLARDKELPADQRQEIVNLMQQVDSKAARPYLTEILQNPKFSELHAPAKQQASCKENAAGAFALCICIFGVLGLLGGAIGGWVAWIQSNGLFPLLLIPVCAIGGGIGGCVVGAVVGGIVAGVVALVCSLRRGSSGEKPDMPAGGSAIDSKDP